jgi:hypothetical protein
VKNGKDLPMDIQTIRNALHRQPFQPFVLRLADGRQLHVPHPDFVAVSKRTVAVIDATNDSALILEPLLIVSLETANGNLPSQPPQAPANDEG